MRWEFSASVDQAIMRKTPCTDCVDTDACDAVYQSGDNLCVR